jgi:hypothetical protein
LGGLTLEEHQPNPDQSPFQAVFAEAVEVAQDLKQHAVAVSRMLQTRMLLDADLFTIGNLGSNRSPLVQHALVGVTNAA